MNSLFESSTDFSLKSSDHRPLTIADILEADAEEFLMDGGGGRRGGGCRGVECSSPRKIVGRLLSGMRRGREKRIAAKIEKEEERGGVESGGLNGGDFVFPASENTESGRRRTETSFNMGVGCSLLYLIAASKNELQKMIELRTQMENHLQNVKEESQRKDTLSKLSEPKDLFAYSTTDNASDGPELSRHFFPQIVPQSDDLPESSNITICNQSFKFETPKAEECSEGMDQLEAELEAELERLQVHLDKEKFLKNPLQQRIRVGVKDIMSTRSQSVNSGEVIDPVVEIQESCSEWCNGVSPYELERRLHELLEARQLEQIRELEAALKCAKRKLHEKEVEISWWKDTAKLISQHVIEGSRTTHRATPEAFNRLKLASK